MQAEYRSPDPGRKGGGVRRGPISYPVMCRTDPSRSNSRSSNLLSRCRLDVGGRPPIACCTCNSDLLDGIRLMIRTRTAGQVAAMIPDRLCCCPEVTTEAEAGLEPLARP